MLACSSVLFDVFGLLACTAPVPTWLPCLPSYHDLPSGACAAAGKPRGYAFIEYEHKDDMKQVNEVYSMWRSCCLLALQCIAWEHADDMKQVGPALVC